MLTKAQVLWSWCTNNSSWGRATGKEWVYWHRMLVRDTSRQAGEHSPENTEGYIFIIKEKVGVERTTFFLIWGRKSPSSAPPGWVVEFSRPYTVKAGLSRHDGNIISGLSTMRVLTWKCALSINCCFFDVFRACPRDRELMGLPGQEVSRHDRPCSCLGACFMPLLHGFVTKRPAW